MASTQLTAVISYGAGTHWKKCFLSAHNHPFTRCTGSWRLFTLALYKELHNMRFTMSVFGRKILNKNTISFLVWRAISNQWRGNFDSQFIIKCKDLIMANEQKSLTQRSISLCRSEYNFFLNWCLKLSAYLKPRYLPTPTYLPPYLLLLLLHRSTSLGKIDLQKQSPFSLLFPHIISHFAKWPRN